MMLGSPNTLESIVKTTLSYSSTGEINDSINYAQIPQGYDVYTAIGFLSAIALISFVFLGCLYLCRPRSHIDNFR